MKLSRTTTNKIHYIFDQLLPPILRDSKIVMFIPFKLAFRRQSNLVMHFKDHAPFMTDKQIENVYQQLEWYDNERETDLNNACVKKIETSIVGKTVLDVGCGRGYVVSKLASRYTVTGVDIVIRESLINKLTTVKFKKAAIEKLPFKDASFDTVICTHTLEHVRQLVPAIAELRRVTKKRLIIVVPKQRSYKYTFDLHLQFFPYTYSLLQAIKAPASSSCEEIKWDLFYIEDKEKT